MKTGDVVKAFVQIGLMREPKWLVGEVVSGTGGSDVLVDVNGNRLSLDRSKVRLWEPVNYENGTCPQINTFEENNWESLKHAVTRGVEQFFPNEKVEIDEGEKTISVCDGRIVVGAGVQEIKTIVSFREVPVWVVTEYVQIPATRWEPEDVSDIERGKSGNSVTAAKILVDAMWNSHSDGFWESLAYENADFGL